MKTLYGVIGNPIAHSMSPLMHNDAFRENGVDGHYQPFLVQSDELEEAVRGLKVLGVKGFNVTIPHKQAIIPLLDEVDPLAKAIGAVNTVVRREGRFIGYNTDGPGFLRSLKESCPFSLESKKVLLIGAGGAARAIFYSLAASGMQNIDICNRTTGRGEDIIKECPFECSASSLSLYQAEQTLENYDIIVQTTSVGMYPEVNAMPVKVEKIKKGAFVSDIIYNPLRTKLIRRFRELGGQGDNGIGMFVHQGALAFELWTGVKPDSNRMKNVVQQHLGG
ncbi:shikimate dehydrogenase [Rossellomorea vietnamensis]|uniref:Shikimate dehydrogenase (NADP(+)) n=1 Tax=Rossellomorea vietnamensis TaxID=218284 RepID=A0A5D4MH28_9BACI|nr:shikimate dehydrogenase [Rossellomorea vietnamensis]TYS00828.1 shikimate dehydrogenase [Rossellomorea vietnamensis]